MAKIPSGILGAISGRIGNVVGSSWKGINYIRSYVIPGNPNTVAQQTERTQFAMIVRVAKTVLGSIIQVFWDPFIKSNSGWAHFIGINRGLVTDVAHPEVMHMSEGTLEGDIVTGATLAGTDVTVTWAGVPLGNGQLTDPAIVVIYDALNDVAFTDASVTRTDGTVDVAVGAGRNAVFLFAWLLFADHLTTPLAVSYSDSSLVT